jgi:cytoskeletal protein RodZ
MVTVPEQLRQAREARQMTVEQVADITKMRTDHVRALEEGNWAFFAAPVYIRGFVRTYAALLKLDVPEVMSNLDADLGHGAPAGFSTGGAATGPLNALTLVLSKINWRQGVVLASVIGVVCLLAIAWFSFKRYRNADPLRNLKPGIYEPARSQGGETLPVPAPKK